MLKTNSQKLNISKGHTQSNSNVASSQHMAIKKIKFMCSSGGKILPRPSDMKLRYVGGETRMVSFPRHIQYEDFYTKMMELYGPDIIIKYQLPQEDLDALVSVSSDEDLENMLEECDRLSVNEGSLKLRVFVFLSSEVDGHEVEDDIKFKSTERKFVDAINCVSSDALPAHSAAKLCTNSDSFNDAYRAWNGIQSQDQGSLSSKNPYSDGLFSETYLSPIESHAYENVACGQFQNTTLPLGHSLFMGQPVNLRTSPVSSLPCNELDSGGWKDSDSFYGQGAGHTDNDMNWTTTSNIHMHKPNHMKKDEILVSQLFGEQSREKSEVMHSAQEVATYNREPEKASTVESIFKPLKNAGIEDFPFTGLESVDSLETTVTQSYDNQLELSPGALLQKQLMSSPSVIATSQKQVHPDWSSEQDADRNFSLLRTENQQQAFLDHADQWERFPPCESPFVLGEDGELLCHNQYSGTAQAPLVTRESSTTGFPASSPCSTSHWELQYKRKPELEEEFRVPVARLSTVDSAAVTASAQVSTSGTPFPAVTREKVQSNVASIPDRRLAQEISSSNLNIAAVDSYSFSSSHRMDQGGTMKIGQSARKPSDISSDPAEFVSCEERIMQPLAIGNDDDGDCFLPSATGKPGFPLVDEGCLQNQLNDDVINQHENKSFNRFSNLNETAHLGNVPNVDLLSDLLSSCQLTECVAASSSMSGIHNSKSVDFLNDELRQKEQVDSIARTREDPLFRGSEELVFPLTLHGNSHLQSFDKSLNYLPSNEQFDSVLVSSFSSDFENKTSNFPEASIQNQGNVNNPVPIGTRVPTFTSLIETWEASLLQDEDNQNHVMQQGMLCDQAQEQVGGRPMFDKEAGLEEPGAELEEELQCFDYGPMNAAAIAEQEAKSRGLQIIRNCDLEELRELGSGTFGTVYHGKWRGTDVAIKRIKASCFNGREAEKDRLVADFWREAYILGQLHHPNVVAFYGVVPDGPGGTLATVTEYMVNGSLKQVLQNKDRTLDRRKRLLIAMDAAFGMEYLHGKNVVHFDIKCENLLVNLKDAQRPICKVGDLGLSKVKQQTFVSGGVRGTLPWMAPELLNGSSSFVSEKVDVFSFGIVMWELLTGEEPYANMHYGAIIGGIVNNTLRPTVPRWCDPAWKSLMEKCWAADPNERPTFLEITRALRAMEASLASKGSSQPRILGMYQ
ncbi:hypothetical protein KP509_07G100500 [Ceratopteris richardii]|uniref:Protein kinase domain-containing protein n=1 Tax=Ceratopteris richardii TaxID=49495 RepID=A0A8T2UHF9_CERRI|nr:hypothetical protein KP509_07G100500 [Ceratopteris richardii]KAH7434089.1 hypothetical protein KP509_07G100500 [Ceratopteris richardii]